MNQIWEEANEQPHLHEDLMLTESSKCITYLTSLTPKPGQNSKQRKGLRFMLGRESKRMWARCFALDYKTNKGNTREREREREREWKRVVCFGHKAQAFLFLAISTRFGTIDEPPNFHANIIIQTLKDMHVFVTFSGLFKFFGVTEIEREQA